MNKLDSTQIRQGDCLLVLRNTDAAGTAVPVESGRVVLKHGEATGHAHAFYQPKQVKLLQAPTKDRHLRVVTTALLKHEEHTHADVPPGLYDIPNQVEWTDENEPRIVAD